MPQSRDHVPRNTNQNKGEREHSLQSRDRSQQRRIVDNRSRDRAPQSQKRTSRNPNRRTDERELSLHSRDHTPQKRTENHRSSDHTGQSQDYLLRNQNQILEERNLSYRDQTPQRRIEYESRNRTPHSKDHTSRNTNQRIDEWNQSRSPDHTSQRKLEEYRKRDPGTPQSQERMTRKDQRSYEREQSLESCDRTPRKRVEEHRKRDHTPQSQERMTRNHDQRSYERDKSLESCDRTPRKRVEKHRSRDPTQQSHENVSRNQNRRIYDREHSLQSCDHTPHKRVEEHRNRDLTPQYQDHLSKNPDRGIDERDHSREPTPQGRVQGHQSRDRTPQSQIRASRKTNQATDEKEQSLLLRDHTPHRRDAEPRSIDRSPLSQGHSSSNPNLATDWSTLHDHTKNKIVGKHQSRDWLTQSQDLSPRSQDRIPSVQSSRSRDHTPQRSSETYQHRDLTPQSRNHMSRSSSQVMDNVDQTFSHDRTPQRKEITVRSKDHSSRSHNQKVHRTTTEPFSPTWTAETEASWRRVQEKQPCYSPDRMPWSRDHTPSRRSEVIRSRDRTPDTNVSRNRNDLRRVKNPKIVQVRDWSPSVKDKAMRQRIYSQRDRADGKSQDSLSPGSGEKKSVRPGAPSEPNEYNFNYKRRGLFLIINNKNFHPDTGQQSREGTDVDAERLEERFQDLGFEVKRYDDVSRSKMSTLMYDAAAYDHSDADCFGCAILSHGIEGRVYGTDGYVTLEVLVMPFKGDKCPTLVGKPKLFFLQACRGSMMDYGVDVSDSSISSREEDEIDASNTVSIRKIPIEADFLFAYSTVPGYYSWRNNQDGSWFIQALCIVLENYGMKMELLHMLTHVNRIVAYEFASCTDREFTDKMKQMPCVVSMLTRYVYFRHKKQDIR